MFLDRFLPSNKTKKVKPRQDGGMGNFIYCGARMASPVNLTIRIACEGAGTLPISSLKEFQGDLKSLSIENFERLKREILERGFSFPFFVWRNKDDHYLLDGHQRYRTLKAMASKEGYDVPPLPVVYVEAKNKKEAKHKLLSVASQYGKIEAQGLYEFASEAELTLDELKDNFSFPDVDFNKFESEFFDVDSNTKSESDKEEVEKGSLVERFGVPPFTVLDTRQGYWQDRKRAWLSLGIKSELGRGGGGRK